ncbi:MAG: hypothetical protein WBW94_11445 [Anaerolineales bacterium]
MKRIFIFILVGLIITGCAASQQNSTFFDNPVCTPPCWENIRPGITTKDEALTILSRIISIKQSVVDMNQAGVGYDDEIRFSVYKGKNEHMDVSLDILNDRTSSLSFDNFQGDLGIQLNHAVELFGEPTKIFLTHGGFVDQVTLINYQNGIAFGYGFTGNQRVDSAMIEPGTEISEVLFFDPNQYENVIDSQVMLGVGRFNLDNLHPWAGYGSFKDKYWPPATPSQ